jgi:uncharacterized RDD family membrane protein YckC
MTQQGDATSRPPGEVAGVIGVSAAAEPGAPGFPPEPGQAVAATPEQPVPVDGSQAAPAGPGETPAPAHQPVPFWPSPFLAQGEAAPEAYPAPARPGQPRYGAPPTMLPGGSQPGFQQPGYGRQQPARPFGRSRQARGPGTAQPRDPSLAGNWERLLAVTLDWLLILAVSFFILYGQMERLAHQFQALVNASPYLTPSAEQATMEAFVKLPSTLNTLLAYSLLSYGIAIAYFWILQATTGATLGKMLLGLRVVSAADRTRAGVRATGLRTAVFLIGPAMFTFGPKVGVTIGELIALVGALTWVADSTLLLADPQRQTLHDRVAGTVVIRTRGRPRQSR